MNIGSLLRVFDKANARGTMPNGVQAVTSVVGMIAFLNALSAEPDAQALFASACPVCCFVWSENPSIQVCADPTDGTVSGRTRSIFCSNDEPGVVALKREMFLTVSLVSFKTLFACMAPWHRSSGYHGYWEPLTWPDSNEKKWWQQVQGLDRC